MNKLAVNTKQSVTLLWHLNSRFVLTFKPFINKNRFFLFSFTRCLSCPPRPPQPRWQPWWWTDRWGWIRPSPRPSRPSSRTPCWSRRRWQTARRWRGPRSSSPSSRYRSPPPASQQSPRFDDLKNVKKTLSNIIANLEDVLKWKHI